MLLGDRARRDRARRALAPLALRAQLERAGAASLRVRGGSMRPVLPSGSLVELRPPRRGEDLLGAIVAVDAGELVIVHRVCRDDGAVVQTRGIARHVADPVWPREAVIGVVCAHHTGWEPVVLRRSEASLRVLATAAAIARLGWIYRAARRARLPQSAC